MGCNLAPECPTSKFETLIESRINPLLTNPYGPSDLVTIFDLKIEGSKIHKTSNPILLMETQTGCIIDKIKV